MKDLGHGMMKSVYVMLILAVLGTLSAWAESTEDYVCNEPFTVEATQIISTQSCPATVNELNQLRSGAIRALQVTAESECQTAQDAQGNRCPAATALGREPKTAVECAAVELAIPGVPGPGLLGATLRLTISGLYQCN